MLVCRLGDLSAAIEFYFGGQFSLMCGAGPCAGIPGVAGRRVEFHLANIELLVIPSDWLTSNGKLDGFESMMNEGAVSFLGGC